jgi:hypothetical protein
MGARAHRNESGMFHFSLGFQVRDLRLKGAKGVCGMDIRHWQVSFRNPAATIAAGPQ